VHPDLTLLIAAERPLDFNDVRAIQNAANSLIHELESRGLVRPYDEREPS
jgi:hypothetical protein